MGLLELLATIPRAQVGGDNVVSLGDAQRFEVCEDDERPLCPVVRDRIIVEIEADVRCFADFDFDFDTLVSWKWLRGQREQEAALVLERLTDGALAVLDPGTIDGGGGSPLGGLLIEIGEVSEGASREERLADVTDGALDAIFFVTSGDGDGPWLEPVVRRYCEQGRVETARVAVSIENSTLEIVVEQDTRHTAEVRERLDVPAHEERLAVPGKKRRNSRRE
jgi:hypothetical protein